MTLKSAPRNLTKTICCKKHSQEQNNLIGSTYRTFVLADCKDLVSMLESEIEKDSEVFRR